MQDSMLWRPTLLLQLLLLLVLPHSTEAGCGYGTKGTCVSHVSIYNVTTKTNREASQRKHAALLPELLRT